jgi:Domain of unknown function (DUF4268)
MALNIARRQQITNLREIWPKESDLSDWLVTEDGLALIAEDIGVEIEDPRRESRPGDFPCDIVAHALGDESHTIVIENQFGKTNHDHLGKLLTYTSMNTALTGIWLAEQISEDHRTVVDWLNNNTPAGVSFYLAQVRAYRIGDSPVAPQLDVVSRPNVQAKLKPKADDELKERHIWRRDFWEEILTYVKAQNPPFRVGSPGIDAWTSIALGRSHFILGLTLTPSRQCIGCELYMAPAWKEDAFAQLYAQRDAIEAEVGESLQWLPLPGKKAARILLETAIDPRDDGNRDQVKRWMHQRAIAFYSAFHRRVKSLQPSSVSIEEVDAVAA